MRSPSSYSNFTTFLLLLLLLLLLTLPGSHSHALSTLLSLIFKVVDWITSSTMRQVADLHYVHTHTRMCRSVCESSLVSSPFWSTKGRVGLTAVQGRAGCRCNIFLSIFISFRLPGWLEALTGIYCHLTRLHLLCFTAQHAGWAIPYQMDWMSL